MCTRLKGKRSNRRSRSTSFSPVRVDSIRSDCALLIVPLLVLRTLALLKDFRKLPACCACVLTSNRSDEVALDETSDTLCLVSRCSIYLATRNTSVLAQADS